MTVETDDTQGGLEIVQEKTFAPNDKPVIVVDGDNEFVITPDPETNDHVPTPAVGVLAAMVTEAEEIQTV